MISEYTFTPVSVHKAKTSSSDIVNSGYLVEEGTKKRLSVIPRVVASAILVASVGLGPLPVYKSKWLPQAGNTALTKTGASKHCSDKKSMYGDAEQPTLLSARLQEAFGFKTAQWATVLGVERKTLYNWIKHPDTNVQQRAIESLNIMSEFLHEIDSEHAKYISKLAFGRYLDKNFADVLLSKPLRIDELVEEYNRLYAVLDGHYKRNKHQGKVA